MDVYGGFFSPVRVLSYGRPLSIVLLPRSYGKTTGAGIAVLKDFLSNGSQFIYVRRNEVEIEQTAPKFLDTPAEIINDYYGGRKFPKIEEIKYEAGVYYVNGQEAGYSVPLSKQHQFKSANFSRVHIIFYDEFMIGKAGGRYLGSKKNPEAETEALYSLFVTADRSKGKAFRNEVQLLLCGNNERYNSPILHSYGIDKFITRETKILAPKNAPWVCMQYFDAPALSEAKLSNAYALATKYGAEYTFGGIVTNDSSSAFIGKPKTKIKPLFNIRYKKEEYCAGLYDNSKLYIRRGSYSVPTTYALTLEDMSPNYSLAIRYGKDFYLTLLRDSFNNGNITFDSDKSYFAVSSFFAYC